MKKGLNANTLKCIAVLAMTMDHMAWLLYPGYPRELVPLLMHIGGRLTCPIMCFFVAEGYHHSRDVKKYTRRLFLFAVISHFAYVFSSGTFSGWRSFVPFADGGILNQTSVMWPLAWGLVMLRVADSEKIRERAKPFWIVLICLVTFPSDWSCIASLWILAFGTNRGAFGRQMLWMVFYGALYTLVYCFALDRVYGLIQMGVVLAIPLLGCYNGERGFSPGANRAMKWLFYLYYPLHLFVLGAIQAAR